MNEPLQNPALSQDKILANDAGPMAFELKYIPQVDSTNNYAKQMHDVFSKEHPTVIVANEQTASYGRFGRKFYSPKGTGIYLTIVVPISKEIDPSLMTLMTGVSVAETLNKEFSPRQFSLKWINDIMTKKGKCGGILAESVETNQVIIGIGINVNGKRQYPELFNVFATATDKAVVDRNPLIAELLKNFFSHLERYPFNDFLPTYRQFCSTLGKKVTIINGTEEITGIAEKIADDGSLVVFDFQGNKHIVNSGEVTKVDVNLE
jgi:BirA family biotin operon repressor/biotin-[acetyl-CoA-carboxylase] ligase